ncbi:MAG: hypothetical protein ACI9BD_001171 [Candidatus Marinamargulisbacteria bacterium]|jgi:hypothetical protein
MNTAKKYFVIIVVSSFSIFGVAQVYGHAGGHDYEELPIPELMTMPQRWEYARETVMLLGIALEDRNHEESSLLMSELGRTLDLLDTKGDEAAEEKSRTIPQSRPADARSYGQ